MHDVLDPEFEEHINGMQDHAHFPLDCSFCSGTGVHPATMKDINHKLCPVCHGQGQLDVHLHQDRCKPCLRCASSGKEPAVVPIIPCSICKGLGVI